MNDDTAPLSQILERIERILDAGLDRTRFMTSQWDQDAVIRNLEIIGEAAKRVSSGTRARSPSIPWKQLAGFRDIAIHGYDKLDLERIWSFVEKDLTELKAKVRALLRDSANSRRD